MNWLMSWMITVSVLIAGRIISWWYRKPLRWGVEEIGRVMTLWEAHADEIEKHRWD